MPSRQQIEEGIGPLPIPTHLEHNVSYIAPLLLFIIFFYGITKHSTFSAPIINPKKRVELSSMSSVNRFMTGSREVMNKGRSMYPDKPYRVYTNWGEALVLPAEFVNELKSHPDLDFRLVSQDDSHGYIPGWEPFKSDEKITTVVMKNLTKALTKLTIPLSEEATAAIQQTLTDSTEWHEIIPSHVILGLVSRLSSRVFIGEEMCHNEEWIKASSEYTTAVFGRAMDKLGTWPRSLRPLVHWFMPEAREVREKLNAARRAIKPMVEQRQARKAEALARGENPPEYNDSLEWFEQEYTAGYDPAVSQITLSIVAIHTTSDLLQMTMFSIARHPELFAPLREEAVRVLGSHGLTKVALYDLKLMDSVIKEAQRIKPVLLAPWRRRAMKDIKLSNGYRIPKGTRILVGSTHMQDSQYYDEPEKFDGYRFLRLRETPGKDKMAHLVSTSEQHLGFGHGQHACPGRFFAANEIKIALCHLLLKYDWKLPEGHDPNILAFGMSLVPDPSGKLLIRRRKEEIDLASLSA